MKACLTLVLLLLACARPAPLRPRVARAPEANDPALAARVAGQFPGPGCVLERTCGGLVGIDCQSAVDGPYYYADAATLAIVATCGGACMSGPCADCPPAAWDCTVY